VAFTSWQRCRKAAWTPSWFSLADASKYTPPGGGATQGSITVVVVVIDNGGQEGNWELQGTKNNS